MRYSVFLIMFFFVGCATLGMIADEASQVTADEISLDETGLGELIGTFVPGPYKVPALLGVGYILAIIRRIYKKKKGAA